MKATFQSSYRSKNKGSLVFRYTVTGTQKELEQFEEAQGEYYRKDDNGKPMWFTTRFSGNSVNLVVTSKGNVIADMSQFDAAHSLASQYGGNLGTELARTAAALLMGAGSSMMQVPDVQDPVVDDGGTAGNPDLDQS